MLVQVMIKIVLEVNNFFFQIFQVNLIFFEFQFVFFSERNDRFDQRNGSGRKGNKGNFKQRVAFKSMNQRSRPIQNAKSMILKHLDSDVVMNGESNEKKDSARQRRGKDFSYNRNSPKLQSRGPMRYSEFNWYRITVR